MQEWVFSMIREWFQTYVMIALTVIIWSLDRIVRLLQGLTKGVDALCAFEGDKVGIKRERLT
jgi:hypothetical protein